LFKRSIISRGLCAPHTHFQLYVLAMPAEKPHTIYGWDERRAPITYISPRRILIYAKGLSNLAYLGALHELPLRLVP